MNAAVQNGGPNLAVLTSSPLGAAIERVLVEGDLTPLTLDQRVAYYKATCDSVGLNPLTKPFDYLRLNGKLVLYANKNASDQLRKIHGISIVLASKERIEDVYVVTARATDRAGRVDESTGAVPMHTKMGGEALANALMKCETKAKRRVTLSIVGLSMLDESEVETIPGAQHITSDGEVIEVRPAPKTPPTATVLDVSALVERFATIGKEGTRAELRKLVGEVAKMSQEAKLALSVPARDAKASIDAREKAAREADEAFANEGRQPGEEG